MPDLDLERRIEALEKVVRRLSAEQIVSFNRAVKEAPALATWQADERFWLQGTGGIALTQPESKALESLWTRMLAGLSFAVTHEQVEAYVTRPTLMGRLDRLVASPRSLIEARATTVLERTFGGEVWRGVIGIWNALCAAMLGERLPPSLRSDLGSVWRHVMGQDLEL